MSASIQPLRFALLFCFCLGFSFSRAQPFLQWHDSIPVVVAGNALRNPWAGGLNSVQFSNIDLDLDGTNDVVTFDRSGNKLRTYITQGSVDSVDLRYEPQYESAFPYLHDWALLVDYNCDGKADIFSFSDSAVGVKVYKNISSTSLQFMLVEDVLLTKYNPSTGIKTTLYITPVDLPAFTDVDNDGDLDIITFANSSTYLEYHQNQSMDLYGSCDSLLFEMGNKCWGYAAEDAMSNNFTLNDTCAANVSSPEFAASELRSALHAAGAELCLDLNGDGAKDLVVGDISYNNLTMLMNDGTPTDNHFGSVDINFPANNASTTAAALTTFPAAYYADADNDGIRDLIVSPNSTNFSENNNSMWFYKNIGADNFPDFEFIQNDLLQDQMIDLGEGAYPTFFDYDNDGLKDLFVGNFGYFGTSFFSPRIAQYRNTGTLSQPVFTLVTLDYGAFGSLGITNMIPAFGDLDGDTDSDLIIGDKDGRLQYFENVAAIGATANFSLTSPNLKNSAGRVIDIGDYAAPQIVDVDGDSKNDIIVGGRNGKLAYFHHSGSGTASVPVMDSMSYFWGGVKVNRPAFFIGYSYPFLFKQGAVSRLLVGAESGYLLMYDNIDGNLGGTFTKTDSTFLDIFQGTRTAPFGADITNDGLMDLIVGNYSGGLSFYKGASGMSVNEYAEPMNWNISLFPNPSDDHLNISIANPEGRAFRAEISNVLGQLLSENEFRSATTIETGHLPAGIYFCRVVRTDRPEQSLTRRFILNH